MPEHRFTIPCEIDPDEAEHALSAPIAALTEDGWEAIAHIETVGFFGWTLRAPDEGAVGVSVPQPGGPNQLMIRGEEEALARTVAETFAQTGPLAGRTVEQLDTEKESLRGP